AFSVRPRARTVLRRNAMKKTAVLSAILLAAIMGSTLLPLSKSETQAPVPVANSDALHGLAIDAAGEDAAKAAAAIRQLREARYEGLNALIQAYPAPDRSAAAWPRISHAFDEVAMQKDAAYSHLYWFTDLEAAKAEAARSGKSILTLRMLGKLNEDLSC